MATESKIVKTISIEEFLQLTENNFTEREKFSYLLSFKNEEPKSVEDWKTKIGNGN